MNNWCERSVDPSSMSLIGLVRHLTEVEKYWFHRALAGNDSAEPKFWTAEHPDGDFDLADPAQAEQDLEDFRQIVKTSDEIAAALLPRRHVHPPRPRGRRTPCATSTST